MIEVDRPEVVIAGRSRGLATLALAGIVLPYLLLSFLFFGLVQLQHLAFGQAFILHQHIRTAGFAVTLIAVAVYVLIRGRFRLQTPGLIALACCYCAYVMCDSISKILWSNLTPGALIYAVTFLYFYVFFLFLVLLLASDATVGVHAVDHRKAFRFLFITAIPIFVLGYAQWLLDNPLIAVSDESGYAVEAFVFNRVGRMRAFSIFGSGFGYGHFISLTASLALALLVCRQVHNRKLTLLLLGLSAFAVFTTYTRNSYLEYLLSLFAVGMIHYGVKKGWRNGPIITASALIALLGYVAFLGLVWSGPILAQGLTDVRTFGVRLLGIANVLSRFFIGPQSAGALMFGHGYMQGQKFAELQGARTLMFDNTYLDIALFSGFVGLIWHLVFFVALFWFVLNKYRRSGSYWWLGLAGMYFSYPLVSAINIYVSTLYLITCLVIAYDALAHRQVFTREVATATT